MSAEQKIAALDDMFRQAETTKVEFGQTCAALNSTFQDIINQLKAEKGTELPELLKKLKSFLDSGVSTMNSIETELRSIVSDCGSIQNIFSNMGA